MLLKSKSSVPSISKDVLDSGYDETEFHGQSNWVKAKLNLQFKPKEMKRLKGGDFNTVLVTFQANPKPINGEWRIGETMVPLGKASEDNVFRSSELSPIENS